MAAEIRAEMVAQVHSILIEPGTDVAVGDTVLLLESMKMEIPVLCEDGGTLTEILVAKGDSVAEGQPLVVVAT